VSSWRGCALGLAVLMGLTVLGLSHARGASPDRVVKLSNKSFDHVIQQLRWRLGGYGITIVSAFDYQQIFRKIKTASKRSVVLEILRRPWVRTILEHDPANGLAIPLRVYIYEQADGKTSVSYYKPSELLDSDDDALKAFGQGLDEKLEAIVQAAIR